MVKEAQKPNGLWGSIRGRQGMNTTKSGFMLIELVIVLFIIAILAATVAPRIRLFTPAPCDEFVAHFNRLLRYAYVRALRTGKLHRIFFKVNTSTMQLEVEKTTPHGKREFELVDEKGYPTQYTWNSVVELRNFFIKKIDENARGSLKEAWMYVLPAGLTQEIIINIEDTQRHMIRGLVVNPFSSQCAVYETLQKA
jgi:prepilin-type N-terminal cleavage/methylation domain-containing protein